MLNLQTITEELGTICRRRAWVVVTSQEDMDAVLGDMSKTKKQDFSKIQGRFFPPLSLSSANVDEVIQSRLLAKRARREGRTRSRLQEEGRHPQEPTHLQELRHDLPPVQGRRGFRQELPLRPVPVPTDPENLRGDPQGRGHGYALGPWRAVDARCLPVGGQDRFDQRSRRPGPAVRLLPVHRELPRYGGQEDHRPSRRQPQPGAVRHPTAPGSLPHPVCGRDEGERGQPRDPLPRSDRRRPAGPAPPHRREPGATGKRNAHQPQRRQLLLPDQRRTGHQQRDQSRSICPAARKPNSRARSSSRTC